eukprot:3019941-Amphidinium_carterae.1
MVCVWCHTSSLRMYTRTRPRDYLCKDLANFGVLCGAAEGVRFSPSVCNAVLATQRTVRALRN